VKKTKLLLAATLAILLTFMLASCSADKSGRKELADMMFSQYTAEVDFLFEYGESSVSGSARVTRGENVRIDILSPDPYSGISVESDAADNAGIISISYSGIRADINKNVLDKISLVLSMFSDTAASAVDCAPKGAFLIYEEAYSSDTMPKVSPYEARFSAGNTDFIYIYDSISGTPLDMYAKTDNASAQIKIKKFKLQQ
jgi:hypothetical protein